jgi:hypothetical protein
MMLYEHCEGLSCVSRQVVGFFMASVVYLAYCAVFLCFAGS